MKRSIIRHLVEFFISQNSHFYEFKRFPSESFSFKTYSITKTPKTAFKCEKAFEGFLLKNLTKPFNLETDPASVHEAFVGKRLNRIDFKLLSIEKH